MESEAAGCVSLHITLCECISDHLSHHNQHFGKMMTLCGENNEG